LVVQRHRFDTGMFAQSRCVGLMIYSFTLLPTPNSQADAETHMELYYQSARMNILRFK